MERSLAIAVFGALVLAALVGVPLSGSLLPPLVASHFNAAGVPDAIMPRTTYILMMTAFTAGLPLLAVATTAWRIARRPGQLRLPNAAYWLAPERLDETAAYITLHMTRFGSMLIVFLGIVHALVVRANLLHPPRLELVPLLSVLAVFLLATALWAWQLRSRFATLS